MKSPQVWIIVLHWKGIQHTLACLASLNSLTYDNYTVVLVDNGSQDLIPDDIKRQFPKVKYLRLDKNYGFAGGSNKGIEYCLKNNAEYVWLLNNDTRVHSDSLSLLVEAALENPKAALLAGAVKDKIDQDYLGNGLGEIDYKKAKTYLRPCPQDAINPISCEWICGCNLLIKASAAKELGAFAEEYFLYFEDTEICYRYKKAGYDCLLVPQACVEHIGGASTQGAIVAWRAYYYTRNRLLFFMSALEGISRIPAMLSIYGHIARHALVLPWRGEAGKNQLKAELLGLKDYLNGNFGQAQCLGFLDDN